MEMKYPLSSEIFKLISEHKGGNSFVVGNPNTLKQMREGQLNPTIKTLKTLFEINGMPAEITVTVKKEGKKGKTKIKL